MKHFFAVITICVCFGLLDGCKSPEKSKQTSFFEWTDAYNRQVSLEKEPARIVSLSPAITEMMYHIGAQEKLVGVSDFCDYPEAAKKLPHLGGMQNINMEALLATHPDVVLIGSIVSKKDVAAIEQLKIPVITLKEESKLEGLADMMIVLGKITNHEEQAEVAAADWRSRIQRLKETAKANDGKQKSVYYVVGFGDAGDFTAPKTSHIHEIIELAGCRNVGEHLTGWNVSREYLFQTNPDIILVRKEDCDAFRTRKPYTMLKAVQNNQVYPIESGWIDGVSLRNLDAVEMLSQLANQ